MRRTSCAPVRAVSRSSSSSPRSSSGRPAITRSICNSIAVSVCPTSSCSSPATRRRSASCTQRALRALSRRSFSSRSSMPLNASVSAATSASAASMATRRPGESGSMRCIVSVNVASGRNARPSRTRLTSSMAARPATRTAISLSRMGDEIVIGPKASTPAATPSTAASIRKIRQNSDGGRATERTATAVGTRRRASR